MTLPRTPAALALCLATALTLSACSSGADPAALAASDVAFKGAGSESRVAPVAARSVMVGLNGANSAACGTPVVARGATAVRWSNSADGPVKASIDGAVAPCEVDGAWTGIVFPAPGQNVDDCAVDVAVRTSREYQGPCRWGWVESSALAAPAAS